MSPKTPNSADIVARAFELAPIGYVALSESLVIRAINAEGAGLLGSERSHLVGALFRTFVAVRDLARFDAFVQRLLWDETKQSTELALRRADGASLQVRLNAVCVERSRQNILAVVEEVAERKLEERPPLGAEQSLQDQDQRRTEFLAVLSHELRNPMAAIRHATFVLARAEPGSSEARNMYGIVDRQVARLTALIDGLVDVTRIGQGKLQLRAELVDLTQLLLRVLDDHRLRFQGRDISVHPYMPADAVWVNGDPERLTQVLGSLLRNAEKFSEHGGRVVVCLEATQALVTLRVQDQGIGIAPEFIGQVFRPFTQAPQTIDRPRGGLGLDLHMVKAVVELQGGTVRIHSEGLGHGAELTLTLPRVTAPQTAQRNGALGHAERLRVVLIDDNVDAAETLREALSLLGHTVQVAHEGISGIECSRTFHPHIVICDIGLPGMDGYSVARVFRAEPALRDVYLVALSGYASAADAERAFDAGFASHLAKPVDLDSLDVLLREAASAACIR